jgi:hypothetical protein
VSKLFFSHPIKCHRSRGGEILIRRYGVNCDKRVLATYPFFSCLVFSCLSQIKMSLNFHGSFSYKNNRINVIRIRDNVNMRVRRESNQVASIFFVNDQGGRIRVPQGIIVRDTSDNTNVNRSRLDRQSFLIS